MTLPDLALILGGTRSGKSAYAESLIASEGQEAYKGVYIATAEARDDEMRERINTHRTRRGPSWQTIEEPLDLCAALHKGAETSHGAAILVDCLTLWASNLMAAHKEIDREVSGLLETLKELDVPVIMVSSEVGLGIVPDHALGRRFRDAAGTLNQRVAALADQVVFVAAGLPLILKDHNRKA